MITWQSTFNRKSLFDHVVRTCGTNSRSLSVINPSLTRSPNLLISKHWKCWWTVPMYVEPFLLFITKRRKFKHLELIKKLKNPWSGTLNEWILTSVIKCCCGQLISIHTVPWTILENHYNPVQAVLSALWLVDQTKTFLFADAFCSRLTFTFI